MPQKSATRTNTNTPLYYKYNSPPPFNGGLFYAPTNAPFHGGLFHAPTKAPITHPAEHPSIPCKACFHAMQSTHPYHAEHASIPCRACFHTLQMPPHKHTPAEKEPSSRPHIKKGAPTSRRNTLSHIFNSPPLGRGWGWVFTAPPPHRSCPRCRRCTPPPSGR